jgi:hypothetical protein
MQSTPCRDLLFVHPNLWHIVGGNMFRVKVNENKREVSWHLVRRAGLQEK